MEKSHQKRPKTVAFVQVRMGSTRFPGKVMKKIGEREIFLVQLDRMKRAKTLDQIIVVTTTKKLDEAIVRLCKKNKIPCFRGSEDDLLDRYYQAAKKFKVGLVVKIPSDEPLIGPTVIDQVVGTMHKSLDKYDYVGNLRPPTFPDGLDVEVMTLETLETAWREAKEPHEREHLTPYIWSHSKLFKIGNVVNKYGHMYKSHRWTLDYPEDFEFFKAVFSAFKSKKHFSMKDILDLLKKHPEIAAINAKHSSANWFRHKWYKVTS